jgi:coproporphyrinogen III oxidase
VIDQLPATRRSAAQLVARLQERICAGVIAVEEAIGARSGRAPAAFLIDEWSSGAAAHGISGGGSTRVIADGAAFEKGGVNISIVTGAKLPPSVVQQRPELDGHGFFAAGVSVVLHPHNPYAPTAHCNYRYFEAQAPDGEPSAWWFGGGSDLTPYYPQLEDVRHFHATLRAACDRHDAAFYPAFKAWCDRYFFLKHRNETRGIGGIFYDYVDASGFGEADQRTPFEQPRTFEQMLAFMTDAGNAFPEAYLPLVERHALDPFGERERDFQLVRRGRYVEFNLVYDRGTHFGLQSGGRTESILMSLPPLVRWEYNAVPEAGTAEAELARYLRPRDWFAEDPFHT